MSPTHKSILRLKNGHYLNIVFRCGNRSRIIELYALDRGLGHYHLGCALLFLIIQQPIVNYSSLNATFKTLRSILLCLVHLTHLYNTVHIVHKTVLRFILGSDVCSALYLFCLVLLSVSISVRDHF